MRVEILAVNEISNLVAGCQHLVPYIDSNDRTLLTDGHIDLHSGLRQSREDFVGRVSVQVKGQSRKRASQRLSTYRVPRVDLLAYQAGEGVLYFVVLIGPTPEERTAYYALLSPFAIAALLEKAPAGSKVSVPLKEVPKDPAELERLVTLAHKTREQRVSLGFDPILLQKMKSITVHSAADLDFDVPLTLNPGAGEVAVVLNTTDGLSIHLDGILEMVPGNYLPRTVDIEVGSNGTAYSSAVVRRLDEDSFEMQFSEAVRLIVRGSGRGMSTDISLTLVGQLSTRLQAVRFFLGLIDTRVITVNGQTSPFTVAGTTSSDGDDDGGLRQHLAALEDLASLFDALGVDLSLIDLSRVDDGQANQLNMLYRALMRNEELAIDGGGTSRVLQQVGPWNLELLMLPGTSPGRWRFEDPFAPEAPRQWRWREKGKPEMEAVTVTAYDVVEDEHLPTILNLRLDSVVAAYEAIADAPDTTRLANERVLAFLAAADVSTERRLEFLRAASRLNDWLIAEEGATPIHDVNRWQILFRQELLTPDDEQNIRALKRQVVRDGGANADLLELGCAILLKDDGEVSFLVDRLGPERMRSVDSWPIWKLHPLTSSAVAQGDAGPVG
ncbi:hypothetical protein Q9R20_06375 [Microbacterium sp. PRF11]|uniref:hypothetical protein n=1 Tax=Microbacterium sp. PRF11 TaxID=2962593 RepID=UPI002882358C|nr:hypothetical protein [Microbacterium sp. PRF11]MDT0116613.1 hypothetical protein [Microbacterium sp. PRF11]